MCYTAQLVHEAKVGLPNTYNALVYVTFCVGSYLFTLGCFLMTVPIINDVSLLRASLMLLQRKRTPHENCRHLGNIVSVL